MTPAEAAARLPIALAAAIAAQRAAIAAGAERIKETIVDAIGTMDGPGTQAWPGLADSTLDRKAQLGELGRVSEQDILLATGALRESWSVDLSDPDRPTLGTTAPYAGDLEHGTRTMPARPLAGPAAEKHGAEIAAAVQLAAGEAFKAAMAGP